MSEVCCVADSHPDRPLIEHQKQEKVASRPSVSETLLTAFLESRFISCLPYLSLLYMTYTSVTAIVRFWPDFGTLFFVVGTYSTMVLLFWCMKMFEKMKEIESPEKERLKYIIWTLAMFLNLLFTYRVTVLLDTTIISVVVWAIAACTMAGGFYCLLYLGKETITGTTVAIPK